MPAPIQLPTGVAVETTATNVLSVAMDSDETAGGAEASPIFAPPIQPDEIGKLGPYRVLKQLGHGGMGAVYLALDERLGRKLALKVMLPKFAANPSAKERFLREARAAAQITHDNVVTVYEADERGGVPFIAMQFLQGYPLDEFLKKKGTPSIPQVLRIAKETAAGLAAAHKIGLVHRDIKPGNLWLEAPNGRVKVLDFGLARPVDSELELTKSGAIIGTPAFMSPEQGRGQKVDGRTDLFSLGAVLYRLCSGKLPFEGANVMAVLTSLAMDEPTPVRDRNPEVPVALAELIHQLLAKKADDRPQTADEVVSRILAIEGEAPTASPFTTYPQAVYVPMQVTANIESAFADIAADDSDVGISHSIAKPAPKKSMPWLLIGSAFAFLVCAVIAAVVIIKITNKDGSVTEIKVPDGSKIEVDGKPVTPGAKKPNPAPRAADDVDGKAAEYVLSIGGTVKVNGSDRDIKVVNELPKETFQLTVASFRETQVRDAGLANFKDCRNLMVLYLNGGGMVTDAGLSNFKNSKNLIGLDLSGTQVSNTGLANFKDCKDLSELYLTETNVTDAGLAHFKDCKDLWYVNLSKTQVTNVCLAQLKDCKKLSFLFLYGTKVSDVGLSSIKECNKLSYLNVSDTQVGDAGMDHLVGNNLTYLSLTKTKVTAAKFEELKKAFPKCKIESDYGVYEPPVEPDRKAAEYVLSIGGTVSVNGVADKEINVATDLPKEAFELTLVGLGGNKQVTDAGLANFKDCKKLTILRLNNTQVSDAGLVHFKDSKNITELTLAAAVSDVGLANFKDCKNMTALYVGYTSVSDGGLAHFKDCKNMTVLYLGNTSVSDAGVAHFKDCKNLTSLLLFATRVTDVGLTNFKDCKNLTYLSLKDTIVGDAGLEHLKDCKSLTNLVLHKTKVTAAKFEELKKAFPKCKIESDHGTYDPAVDPDRKAAEYALSIGGKVQVSGKAQLIAAKADLPVGPFSLSGVILRDNKKILDAEFAAFQGCTGLVHLDLYLSQVGDAGLASFKDCKSLTVLNLNGNKKVTEAGLAHFKGCKNLTHLALASTKTNDVGFGHFKDCLELDALYFDDTDIGDDGFALFKDSKKLRELGLNNTKVTDASLARFKDTQNLTNLNVVGTQVTDAGLANIKDCKNLTKLWLQKTKISAAKFEELKRAFPKCRIESDHGTYDPSEPDRKAAEYVLSIGGTVRVNGQDKEITRISDLPPDAFLLKRAELSGPQVIDAGLANFKGNMNLVDLRIVNAAITDAGLIHFKTCNTLTHLLLSDLKVGDKGLASFKDCANLTYLNVTASEVTDDGLSHFKECKKLGSLGLDRSNVTDKGLAHFSEFIGLTQLSLKHCANVGNVGLAHFKDCKNLAELVLDNTQIDDTGLAIVKEFAQLRTITLRGTKVGDAGLEHLKECKNLRNLDLVTTKITAAKFEDLKKEFPKCKIESDHGTYDPSELDRKAIEWLLGRKAHFAYTGSGGYRLVEDAAKETLPAGVLKLNSFKLGPTSFTNDADMARFSGLEKLDTIVVERTAFADAGLMSLAGLPKLEKVYFSQTKITDDGLKLLGLSKSLKVLHVNGTAVTDVGLKPLHGLVGLTELQLLKTGVTAAGVKAFSDAVPGCKIIWDKETIEPRLK